MDNTITLDITCKSCGEIFSHIFNLTYVDSDIDNNHNIYFGCEQIICPYCQGNRLYEIGAHLNYYVN